MYIYHKQREIMLKIRCGVERKEGILCSLGFVEDKLDAVLKVLALNPKVSFVVHLRNKPFLSDLG